MKIKNCKGQGMIEYVILVALISVASIGIVSIFGHTVKAKLSQITAALQGRSANHIQVESVEEKHWRKRGLNDFYKSEGRSDD
ncbi:MAG: hypothetical protein HYW47_04050 [Deltaproteobacteria bacterium]|nr:hypothetical protein [Deltaproteobacteria bacterium]